MIQTVWPDVLVLRRGSPARGLLRAPRTWRTPRRGEPAVKILAHLRRLQHAPFPSEPQGEPDPSPKLQREVPRSWPSWKLFRRTCLPAPTCMRFRPFGSWEQGRFRDLATTAGEFSTREARCFLRTRRRHKRFVAHVL